MDYYPKQEAAVEPSFFLAKFWGGLLMITPLCYLVRSGSIEKLVKYLSQEDTLLIYVLAGYISIILGLTTLILHSSWSLNLGLLITLIGWGSLISGALHVVFADKFYLLARKVQSHLLFLKSALLVSLILGILLLSPF